LLGEGEGGKLGKSATSFIRRKKQNPREGEKKRNHVYVQEEKGKRKAYQIAYSTKKKKKRGRATLFPLHHKREGKKKRAPSRTRVRREKKGRGDQFCPYSQREREKKKKGSINFHAGGDRPKRKTRQKGEQ